MPSAYARLLSEGSSLRQRFLPVAASNAATSFALEAKIEDPTCSGAPYTVSPMSACQATFSCDAFALESRVSALLKYVEDSS